MEFLPIEKDGARVYAGFWRRFGALVVDAFVLAPFLIATLHWLPGVSIPVAMLAAIATPVVSLSYTIYFHYRWGATLGKMAAGIRVTVPNGSPIGFKQAFLRSAVDVGFAVLAVTATVIAIHHADPAQYLSAGSTERTAYIRTLSPAWRGIVDIAAQVWAWSEVIVLLFNKRKRALHDLIAGTVVIYKEHAEERDGRPDAVAMGAREEA